MGLFDGLFGKKRRTLDDLSSDDLRRERIALENEQRKLDGELERLDRDERQLKSEYAEASSPTQKRALARRIQDGRMKAQAAETKAAYCHKMLRTVSNFMIIKENMEFFERVGVASALAQMDTSELEQFINDATVEGTLRQEKLAGMLQQVSDGVDRISDVAGDESLDDLMAELDGESAGGVAQSSGSVEDPELNATMRELDEAIAKGKEAAQRAQKTTDRRESPEREA